MTEQHDRISRGTQETIIPIKTENGTIQELVLSEPKQAKLRRALYTGGFTVGNITIDCAVLEDETRVVTQRGVFVALGRNKNPTKGQASIDDRPAFLAAKNLEPFIPEELRRSWSPVVYLSQGGYKGNMAFGYRAEILPMVCGVYIDAEAAGKLYASQADTAKQCHRLLRGFATIGIYALVDEATGYQEVRDRMALQKILERYISAELLPYQKIFPNEFYERLFKLRNWQWKPMSVKRPKLVGRLTKDLVYQRLAPGVLDALLELTPRRENGRLEHHLHRHLTQDEGRAALERHLHTVTAFMRGSTTWTGFMRLMNRSLPKYNSTLPLLIDTGDDEDDK